MCREKITCDIMSEISALLTHYVWDWCNGRGPKIANNMQHQYAMCKHTISDKTAQIKHYIDIILNGVHWCISFMWVKRLISHIGDIWHPSCGLWWNMWIHHVIYCQNISSPSISQPPGNSDLYLMATLHSNYLLLDAAIWCQLLLHTKVWLWSRVDVLGGRVRVWCIHFCNKSTLMMAPV